jgi:hypothetical protein
LRDEGVEPARGRMKPRSESLRQYRRDVKRATPEYLVDLFELWAEDAGMCWQDGPARKAEYSERRVSVIKAEILERLRFARMEREAKHG